MVIDQTQEGRRRRETRQALQQARPRDHGRRARRRRRHRRQPGSGTAVQKAREASMPKDKIQKAIDTGTGAGSDGAAIERIVYEGYGPAGVAVLVEALTDNRNRASAEIRHAFSSHGGSLGEPGSVAWNFEKKGVVVVDAERYCEDDLMPAIDAGAEDVREEDGKMRVLSEPTDLTAVREALEEAGVEIESATMATEPKSTVELQRPRRRAAAEAARRARRPGRRRRGLRQLRYSGCGARGASGVVRCGLATALLGRAPVGPPLRSVGVLRIRLSPLGAPGLNRKTFGGLPALSQRERLELRTGSGYGSSGKHFGVLSSAPWSGRKV